MNSFLAKLHTGTRWVFAIFCLGLSLFVCFLPAIKLIGCLRDPSLRNGEIHPLAWQLSKTLAPRYAKWAKDRVEAAHNPGSVSGTEWPLFGSVFYLQAVEALQKAWEADHSRSEVAPAVYSREAIDAAAALITDPGQAKWVQQYWGKDYLHKQDLFYRYLLISGMTSYTELTADGKYREQLRDQVETLSSEIDASPLGYLDDYPGQCYPPDIISALSSIQRADHVLHTDHGAMLKHALRAFTPPHADKNGLPYYNVMVETGFPLGPSRGTGNSFNFIATPALWPEQNAIWYKTYVDQFWQTRNGVVGFREYAKDTPDKDMQADVDSGPIIWNFGVAASAFGVGTTRAQGDLQRAAPLTAEMLIASIPMPDGTLLMPRLLSDMSDAPYLGEAGILYCLTRPVPAGSAPAAWVMSPFSYASMFILVGIGFFLLLPMAMLVRETRRRKSA